MAVPDHEPTVAAVRSKYGPKPTADECVEICNEVAWIHRGEGFGIGEKTSGTYGTRSDGQKAAVDGVIYRPPQGGVEQFIDVLKNAQGSTPPYAVPQWGVHDSSNRKWIAPIKPADHPDPPDPPPSQDYVTRDEFQAFKVTTQAQLAQLRADVSGLARQVQDIDDRVDALEQSGPPPPSDPQRYILVGDPSAPPVGVSSELFHSHVLRARVEPVPK